MSLTHRCPRRYLMPALSKIAVAAVALVGGASAGTITSTYYEGAGCTTRFTECGADDVNLPDPDTCGDSCDCAAEDVTEKPPGAAEWTSGECVSCTGDDCEWPFFPQDDDMMVGLRANGADPSYAKVTCANGVTTVEHFSDARVDRRQPFLDGLAPRTHRAGLDEF